MNTYTALVMFAVIAAFGLATLVVPIVPQAHATLIIVTPAPACAATGSCHTGHPTGPPT